MSDEQMRAAFEAEYARKWGLDLRRYVGMHHYCSVETEAQWKAWQAAAQQYQPLVDAARKTAYSVSENHMSGARVVVGFNSLSDAQGFQQALVTLE